MSSLPRSSAWTLMTAAAPNIMHIMSKLQGIQRAPGSYCVWKSRSVHESGGSADWSLLFKAQVANVSLIDSDDAVVLLEESLLLCFTTRLQALHEQALSSGSDHMTAESQRDKTYKSRSSQHGYNTRTLEIYYIVMGLGWAQITVQHVPVRPAKIIIIKKN